MLKNQLINIALIDDEEDFLIISKKYLMERNQNYQIETFKSPLTFLDYLKNSNSLVNVVISDFEMPEMNGLDLLTEIKKNNPKISFIMVTGKGREEIIIEALNQGADIYLQKSIELESLYKELNHFVLQSIEKNYFQNQLNEFQTLYKTLVNLLPEAILIHVHGIIQFCNQSLIEKLGNKKEEDLLGKKVLDILHKDFRKIIQKRINLAENDAEMPFADFKFIKSDGTIIGGYATGRKIQYKGDKGIISYIRFS